MCTWSNRVKEREKERWKNWVACERRSRKFPRSVFRLTETFEIRGVKRGKRLRGASAMRWRDVTTYSNLHRTCWKSFYYKSSFWNKRTSRKEEMYNWTLNNCCCTQRRKQWNRVGTCRFVCPASGVCQVKCKTCLHTVTTLNIKYVSITSKTNCRMQISAFKEMYLINLIKSWR